MVDQIAEATRSELAPVGDPEGKFYVPSSLQLTLLDSVHSFPGSRQPADPFAPP